MPPDSRGVAKPEPVSASAPERQPPDAPSIVSALNSSDLERAAPFDSAEYWQSVLQSARMGTWDWDYRTHTVTVSRETRAIYGLPDAPVIVGRDLLAQVVHPDDRDWLLQTLDSVLAGQRQYRAEFRILWPDGSLHWIEHRGQVYPDDAGKPGRMLGTCIDITERKLLEEEGLRLRFELERHVAERTRQLEAANKELEAFAYSVSHDLRAPLRGIDGFSLAILEDKGDRLDAPTRESLAVIRAETQRMGQLIDDLLNLSHVTRSEMRRETVNISDMAVSVASSCAQREPDRRVTFRAAPNLIVSADARLLRIALENLIGNAWKFTVKRDTAIIEVGAENQNGEIVYFVRDNGAGFDSAYAHKLFGAFQRLHRASELVGSGIGLATVQRIVHRHGGQVWAKGAGEQGATFFFTLPQAGEEFHPIPIRV